MQKISTNLFFLINGSTILILGALAAFVFWYFQKNLAEEQQKASRYFMWHFVVVSLALISTYLRFFNLEGLSILLNNTLYILGIYLLWHGIEHRSGNKFRISKNKYFLANLLLVIFCNYVIFYLWYDSVQIRVVILISTLSIVTLSHFYTLRVRLRHSKRPADTVLKLLVILLSTTNMLLIPLIFINGFSFYITMVMPFQILQCYFISMGLTAILMLDNIHKHYKASITDQLTGLYNRRFFEVEAKKIIDTQERNSAIMICDIDNFKQVNDTYGHHVGDLVIQKVGQHIKEIFTEECIFGRYGGEEFVMLCSDYKRGVELAQLFREKLASTAIVYNDITVNVTISIGVICISAHATVSYENTNVTGKHVLHEYLKYADDALYEAKHTGKNRVCIVS